MYVVDNNGRLSVELPISEQDKASFKHFSKSFSSIQLMIVGVPILHFPQNNPIKSTTKNGLLGRRSM